MDKLIGRHWWMGALLALGLAACGGGGGSGGGVSPPPPPPGGGGTGGIEGTGRRVASYGAITGFGSVYVNGVKYETDKATIQVDGRNVSQSELALGQVVTVVGTLDQVGGTTAVADTVTYTAPIVGPIQSIDVAQATLVVLGQPVLIDGATQFEAGFSQASIGGLAVGMEIEVSGFRDSRGVLAARSVGLRGAGQSLAATGDVASVDSGARRLNLGTLVVDYSAAELAGFGGRQPQGGDFVRAEAGSLEDSGTLKATRLALVDRKLPAKTGESGHLQGRVTRYVSATDFDVDGYRVTTDDKTKFNSYLAIDGFGGLRLDRFVTVFGVLLADGRVLATNIETNNLVTINATVDAVSPYSLKYGPYDCLTAGTTYTVDGESATWSAIRPGDVAILYQSFGIDLPMRCPIVTVNRALRGPVEAVDAARGRLTVMGQSVHVNGRTHVLDDAAPEAIGALATLRPGDVVEVAGYRSSSGALAATRLALASPESPRQVTGPIQDVDTGARRFRVGLLTVDYSTATLAAFPSGGIAAGQRVIVRGNQPAADTLRATAVEYDSPLLRGTAVGPAHVIGPITRFGAVNDFDIEGRHLVQAPPGPTNPQAYAPCVKERLRQDSFITAITATQPVTGVDFAHVGISPGNYGTPFGAETLLLKARVDAVDAARRTLSAGGIDIAVHPFAELTKPGGECGAAMPLAEVAAGDSIWIRGDAGAAGAAMIAGQIERAQTAIVATELQLDGRVSGLTDSSLLLDGLRVGFGPGTSYGNCGSPAALSREEFLVLVRAELAKPGGAVFASARGAPSGGALALPAASEVGICLDAGLELGTLRGQVDSIDAATGRLVVLGIPIQVAPGASVTDSSSGTSTVITLDGVAPGHFVEISIRWFRPLGTRETNSLILQDRNGAGTPYIRARPDEKPRPDVVVFGQVFHTDVDTVFTANSGPSDADSFFRGDPLDTEIEFVREAGGGLRATKVNYNYDDWWSY